MSQYARNNPDRPPLQPIGKTKNLREVFGGGQFAPQAACFRAASEAERTAHSIFNEAFPPSRPKRSEEYKDGVFRHLRYRMMEISDCKCPYPAGSVGSDAFWAGVQESWNLLEKHGADLRAKL